MFKWLLVCALTIPGQPAMVQIVGLISTKELCEKLARFQSDSESRRAKEDGAEYTVNYYCTERTGK